MGSVCSSGNCSANCGAGLAKCGTSCVDLNTDKNNCGFCAQICGGNLICNNANCACPSGTSDCSGVCADLQTSNADCGSCGNACASGTTCVSGKCQ
jgi:hypothetical protein